LRTRLEGLINLAPSLAQGLFTDTVAQLLAHQGHEPSFTGNGRNEQRCPEVKFSAEITEQP
jgi:hypothetical protein